MCRVSWFVIPVFLNSVSTPTPGGKSFSGGSRDQNIPHRPFYPAACAGYITLGDIEHTLLEAPCGSKTRIKDERTGATD